MDMFNNQSSSLWSDAVGQGLQFAFVRVSGGLVPDSFFEQNYTAAQQAGLVRGAYQFFEPQEDPVAQAALVLSKIGTLGMGDLPPALAVEVTSDLTPAAMAVQIHAWVATVENALGRPPIIVTSALFWNTGVAADPSFANELLWIADWNVACPLVPDPWQNWTFWQYTDDGLRLGLAPDLDEFNGTVADLVNLASNYSICPLYDQTKPVQNGSTIPVRLELCDSNGVDLSSASIHLLATGVTLLSGGGSGPSVTTAGVANTFRFDPTLGTNGGYILNLSTEGLSPGIYALDFMAGADPRVHSVQFQVR
jgi:lysozyme